MSAEDMTPSQRREFEEARRKKIAERAKAWREANKDRVRAYDAARKKVAK